MQAKQIYQPHISQRSQPVNLDLIDKALFEKEFEKDIPATTVAIIESASILRDAIWDKKKLSFLDSFTHIQSVTLKMRIRQLILLATKAVDVETGIWVTDNWSKNYFHWMTDSLTRLVACENFSSCSLVLLPKSYEKVPFVQSSLEQLGYFIYYYNESRQVKVRHLILPSHTAATGNYNAEIINKLRAKFSNGVRDGFRKIYISRANAANRKICNEDAVCEVFKDFGYEIHLFENYDFNTQVKLMNQTSHLAGLHGAGMTNMLFMPEKGKILELRNSTDSTNNCYFSLSSDLKHHYYYLLNKGDRADTHSVNINVDLKDLQSVLTKMEMNI